MPSLNTTKHVKIWMTKNPDYPFGYIRNGLRLIRHCINNPSHTIYFIYNEKLLSAKGVAVLQKFCKAHPQVIPYEIAKLAEQLPNDCERQLLGFAQSEMTEKFGGLSAVKDILTCLTPVIKLGIYSDFDVEFKKCNFPTTIEINDFILPMELSLPPKHKDADFSFKINCFLIYFHDANHPVLLRIRKDILEKYTAKQFITPNTFHTAISQYLPLNNPVSCKSPWELRRMVRGLLDATLVKLQAKYKDSLIPVHPTPETYFHYTHDEAKAAFDKIYHVFLKDDIVYRAGPGAWDRAILKYLTDTDASKEIVKGGLCETQLSTNMLQLYKKYKRLHQQISLFELPLADALTGMRVPAKGAYSDTMCLDDKNDGSWLPYGMNLLKSEAETMTQSVATISDWWKRINNEKHLRLKFKIPKQLDSTAASSELDSRLTPPVTPNKL